MVSKAKVTDWFPAWKLMPVREGWYEVKYVNSSDVSRRFYKGGMWFYWNIAFRDFRRSTFGPFIGDQWRGLTKPAGK